MMPSERKFWSALIVCPSILGAGLAIYLLFIPARVLTPFHDNQPLSPLYAFWMPSFSLRILGPLIAGAAYVVWVLYTSRWSESSAIKGWLRRIAIHMGWLTLFAVSLA